MPDELEDDLLERFVRGDQHAFESLSRQFEAEVYRWVLQVVRGERGEDVLVEAFWRAYRHSRVPPPRRTGCPSLGRACLLDLRLSPPRLPLRKWGRRVRVPIRHSDLRQTVGVHHVSLLDDPAAVQQIGGQAIHLVRAETTRRWRRGPD